MENKFFSRKLLICLLGLASTVGLKLAGKIGDWPFAALFGGIIVVYLFVQGTVNISRIKVNTPAVSITPEPEKEGSK